MKAKENDRSLYKSKKTTEKNKTKYWGESSVFTLKHYHITYSSPTPSRKAAKLNSLDPTYIPDE